MHIALTTGRRLLLLAALTLLVVPAVARADVWHGWCEQQANGSYFGATANLKVYNPAITNTNTDFSVGHIFMMTPNASGWVEVGWAKGAGYDRNSTSDDAPTNPRYFVTAQSPGGTYREYDLETVTPYTVKGFKASMVSWNLSKKMAKWGLWYGGTTGTANKYMYVKNLRRAVPCIGGEVAEVGKHNTGMNGVISTPTQLKVSTTTWADWTTTYSAFVYNYLLNQTTSKWIQPSGFTYTVISPPGKWRSFSVTGSPKYP